MTIRLWTAGTWEADTLLGFAAVGILLVVLASWQGCEGWAKRVTRSKGE